MDGGPASKDAPTTAEPGSSAAASGAPARAGGDQEHDAQEHGTQKPGRRLDVTVVPENPYVTWWLRPVGDGLAHAVTEDATPGQDGPRSVLCDFGDGLPVGVWRAWPAPADAADGSPEDRVNLRGETTGQAGPGGTLNVERVLLTVPDSTARFFRPGRLVDVYVRSDRPGLRPVPAGHLAGPAPDPEYLVTALLDHRRSRFFVPVADAPHPWQARVGRGRCAASPDGRELWFAVEGGDDQVLTRVDVDESPECVTLRAWVAFGPDGPRGYGVGPGVRVLPDGRRLRSAYQRGTGRSWNTRVRLNRPLGARAVFDVGSPEPGDRERARRAWRADRGHGGQSG